MSRDALVEVNVSDTDELRMQKVNRNFQLLWRRLLSKGGQASQALRQPSPASQLSGDPGSVQGELAEYLKTDIAYQEFATADSVDVIVEDLKADISWLTDSADFAAAVADKVDEVVGAQVQPGGVIAQAISDAIAAACAEGGAVQALVASAIEECKRYTDEQIAGLPSASTLSTMGADMSFEEKGSYGLSAGGSVAEHSIGADLGNSGLDGQEAGGAAEEVRDA